MIPAALFLVIALVILYVARSIRTFLALRHFGGHWSTGWSRIWLLRTQGSGEMNKRFTAINNKYGECHLPVCRVVAFVTIRRFAHCVVPGSRFPCDRSRRSHFVKHHMTRHQRWTTVELLTQRMAIRPYVLKLPSRISMSLYLITDQAQGQRRGSDLPC